MRSRTTSWTLGLALVGGLGAVAYLVGIGLQLPWLRLASKAVPVVCLALGLWPARERYRWLIVAGLAFSLMGDMLLEARRDLFLPGLCAFLLAHVAYIGAYLTTTREPHWGLGVPFLLLAVGAWLFLRPGLGALATPVGLYVVVICTMMWRAAVLVVMDGPASRERWAALTGALCFAASDALLAFRLFVSPVEGLMSYAIMLLYWSGQLGITLSAIPNSAPESREGQVL